jgi:transposase
MFEKEVSILRCRSVACNRVRLHKLRWSVENAFNRLKDFRCIATKLARNYLAPVSLAAALVWWALMSRA